MPKKITVSEFISRACAIHNNKYGYEDIKQIIYGEKVNIRCKHCNTTFKQLTNSHLKGHGCPICSRIRVSNANRTTLEEFVAAAILLHGTKFGYLKVKYVNRNTEVCILCNTCGNEFNQLPSTHLGGSGCPVCVGKNKTTERFIIEANKVHINKYDYSKFKYTGAHIKGIIICHSHGEFLQTPDNHLHKRGCPKCKLSHGELDIRKFLINNNINFIHSHKFNELVGVGGKPLVFDFYIPSHNLLIEYDGEQHLRKGYFNRRLISDKSFMSLQEHDRRKNQYAKKNNIKLLRIPHTKADKIPIILSKWFNLPKIEEYALFHTKTIEVQRATNLRYNKEFTRNENLGHRI